MIGFFIWALIASLKLMIKFTVLMFWLIMVGLIWFVWFVIVLGQVCLRQPITPFPRNVSRTTNQVLRWML